MVRMKRKRMVVRPDDLISDRVRDRMRDNLMGQKKLAEKLGISEGYLSRILSGHRPWTIELLLKTSTTLKVPVEELDPNCLANLKEALLGMELRGDVSQLRALYTFIIHLPSIRVAEDLDALTQVVRAFAMREARAS